MPNTTPVLAAPKAVARARLIGQAARARLTRTLEKTRSSFKPVREASSRFVRGPLRRGIGALIFQWPLIVTFLLAVVFAAVSGYMRVHDSSAPTLDNYALSNEDLGIYANYAEGSSSNVLPSQFHDTNDVPPVRWTMLITPGERVMAKISLVLLDQPGRPLNIKKPFKVIFSLPPGATEATDPSPLRVGSDGSCASWFNGRHVGYAKPTIQRSYFGNVVETCSIPAVGKVQDLFFDLYLTWPDPVYADAGFGRHASALRLDYFLAVPSDVWPAVPQGQFYTLQPINIRLQLNNGLRVVDSSRPPTDSGVDWREWYLGVTAGEFSYTVEDPRSRVFVQPLMDYGLLLAGVLLGLLPSVRRKRHSSRSTA